MLGERLAAARKMRGMGQAELARRMGDRYDNSVISRVERGRSGLAVDGLIAAAQELGVSTDYLLGLTEDPRPSDERLSPLEPPQSVLIDGDPEAFGRHGDVSTEETKQLPFSRVWLDEYQIAPLMARVYQVKGHILHPTIHSNADILVDYGRTELSHGSVYLVKRQNSVQIGRAYLGGDGWYLFNRRYGNMSDVAPLGKEDEVRGQVCWTARSLLQSTEQSKSV